MHASTRNAKKKVRRGRIFGIVLYLVNVAAHKRMNNYLTGYNAPLGTAQSQGKSAHLPAACIAAARGKCRYHPCTYMS
jgi:hypothetical protein